MATPCRSVRSSLSLALMSAARRFGSIVASIKGQRPNLSNGCSTAKCRGIVFESPIVTSGSAPNIRNK